jgi:O-antigen/teichoic acid export membrane protein
MGTAQHSAVRNLLTGTITKYLFFFVNIVIGVLLLPFTMHHLGKAEYGLWMMVASMTAYFQLLDFGYGNGLVRQVTRADATGNVDEVNTTLSTFFIVYTLIGFVSLCGVAILVTLVAPRFPNLTADQVVTAQWVLSILGVRVAVGFPMTVFGAVTTARQRFALTGAISIAVAIAQGVTTYIVLSAGYGLVPLVAATTLISLASYIGYAAAARATFPSLHLSPRRFSRAHVREVTAFSLYLFLITIAIQLGTNIDSLVIGAYLGTSAVAVYTVAMRLAQYQWQLCGQASSLLFPVIVRMHANGDRAALRTTLLEGTRLALALVGGLTVCMIAFGPSLISAWMGPGFEPATGPLYVLATLGLFIVAQGPTGNILLGAGRHRLVGLVAIIDVLANIALSLYLVRRIGITGAALGTAIPYIILNMGVLVPAACRFLGVPLFSLVRTAAGPPALAAALAALTAFALRAAAPPHTLVTVLGQSGIVVLVYIGAFWFLGLRPLDRSRYRGALMSPLARGVLRTGVAGGVNG